MIYLIESVGRDKNDNKIKSFLKIGYSEDKVFKNRLNNYYLHNPHCDLLYTIPGGTQDQEKLLHYKFKNYLVFRKEWFIDDSGEILDFFKTHPTVELLEKEFGTAKPTYFIRDITGKVTKEFKEIRVGIKSILCKFYNRQVVPESFNMRELLTLYKTTSDKYIKEIGRTIFSIEDFKKSFTEGSLDDCSVDIGNSVVLNFLEEFEEQPTFYFKMKLLCERKFNSEEISIILDQIPINYKSYYTTLGPERCRANGYCSTVIEKEYKNLFTIKGSIEDINNKIYSEFLEGEAYTLKFIKEKLAEIYKDFGLTITPKAVNITKYFEVKDSKITIKGKRVHAFRLVKKKV